MTYLSALSCTTAMHETSKRLSQTLKDVYEPDWNGGEGLATIIDVSLQHTANQMDMLVAYDIVKRK